MARTVEKLLAFAQPVLLLCGAEEFVVTGLSGRHVVVLGLAGWHGLVLCLADWISGLDKTLELGCVQVPACESCKV